jgi:glycerophosphoryl diester phosphodiesterase
LRWFFLIVQKVAHSGSLSPPNNDIYVARNRELVGYGGSVVDIVGHRGAAGHAPENTLRAFARGMALGCQRLELDVQVSADGVAVVIHDETLDRTTNGKGAVDSLTLADLKGLDAGAGERIPTLEEVMHLCRDTVDLQIELKAKKSPPLVAELIKRHWNPKKVVITSFDLGLLDEFAAILGDVPLGLLNKEASLDMIGTAQKHSHKWVCPRFDIVSQWLIEKVHGAGMLVYVYHVNNRDIAESVVSWGADAIGTDFPEMIRELVFTEN